MDSREDVDKLVREAYRRRVAEDVAGVCDLFAPEAEFRFVAAPKAEAHSFAANNPPALRALMGQLIKTFHLRDFNLKAVLIDGSRVAVHWNARVRSNINGQELVTDVLDLMDVQDGKITSFIEFCDTAAVDRMTAAV
jgi:ketosteroid isomerase-like protein